MMSEEVLNKMIIDIQTGEQFLVPYTVAEIAQRDQDIAAYEEWETARIVEQERIEALKVSARAKLIAGEPLTEEEAGVMIQ